MQSIKTKVLTMFMSFVMAVAMFPALGSNAATLAWTYNNIVYKFNESTGVMTVTGTGEMFNFTALDTNGDKRPDKTNAPWFDTKTNYYYKIKKVIIGDGITKIGDNSFCRCYNIESVEFQSTGSLKTIGTQAFYDCYHLTSLGLPNGLVTVGRNAFAYNSALQSVSIPNTVKTIAYGAFACCSNLAKVYIPKSVSSLGDFAFKSNYKLSAVTGGAGLTTIGRQAFEYTYKLRTFSITSKKLSRIGQCCFYCSGLKTIKIKKTTKLKKKKVKGSLYLSSVKTVKVKKSKVRKYRKFFTYRNCGKRRVKVKK